MSQRLKHNATELNSTTSFIEYWNINYPIDRWFRKKYNLILNSKKHRSNSVIDVRMDFDEDVLYNSQLLNHFKQEEESYSPGRGDWLKKRDIITPEQRDKLFNDIDINNITYSQDGKEILI